MSCPSEVVPSQWSPEGCSDGSKARRFGCRTLVNNCGVIAMTLKITNRTMPTIALRLRRAARTIPPPRRRVGGGPTAAIFDVSTRRAVIARSSLRPRTRVQPGDDEVAHQQGEEHGHREQHEQRLHEGVVG